MHEVNSRRPAAAFGALASALCIFRVRAATPLPCFHSS